MRRAYVVAAAIAWLAGCRTSSNRAAAHRNVLRVHVDSEPPTLNPLVEHDVWSVWATLHTIYEPLLRQEVRQDPKEALFLPALAERHELIDDRTIRFVLRKGVKWHDNVPFSSDDVVATLDHLRTPGIVADRKADFVDLGSVDHAVPNEITLHFVRPTPLALQAIAHLPILPAHKLATGDPKMQAISRSPIGTGPFRLREWRAGQAIRLDRYRDYWGAQPPLDGVELRIVRDRDVAFELAHRGEFDLLWRLQPAQVRAIQSQAPAGMRPVAWRLPTYSFVVWNSRRPGLGDRRVRLALTLLTDRDRYLRAVFHGKATPVSGPYPIDSPAYDRTILPWPYDVQRARQLLDDAGIIDHDGDGVRELNNRPFQITFLLVAGSKTLEPLATMMQEDLRKAGIRLDIVPTEWAVLLDRLRKHAFDAAALQWSMQLIQDNYTLFHSSESERGQNYSGLREPDVDRLLDRLRTTPPGPNRIALDHALHRLIHELQPYTFIACPEVVSLIGAGVRGYTPSLDGFGFERMSLQSP